MIGTSPQQILGVQIGMLRAMNSRFGCNLLSAEENRVLASDIYRRYHNYISGRSLNEFQWKYLVHQYEKNDSLDRKSLDYFEKMKDIKQYNTFCRYIEDKKTVDDYYLNLPKFPDVTELNYKAWICTVIELCIEYEDIIDEQLQEKIIKVKGKYAYETDDYFIMVPGTLRELLKEAENQHNCLYQYIEPFAFDDEVIVFVRSKKSPKKSLITMEVNGGKIWQIHTRFNGWPDEKQAAFVKSFAKEKDLVIMY